MSGGLDNGLATNMRQATIGTNNRNFTDAYIYFTRRRFVKEFIYFIGVTDDDTCFR